MKHSIIYQYITLFFIIIVGLLSQRNIYAQKKFVSPAVTDTPISTIIQYDLAFPGILPGNIFYKLKVLRDKIQLIMTTDARKRINLLLHFADKGVLASAMLVDKKNWKLAEETALKAENNMTLLTPEISRLSDPVDQVLLEKLQTASLKHQEIFISLKERVPTDAQLIFSQVIDFSKRNQSEIEKYIEQTDSLQ